MPQIKNLTLLCQVFEFDTDSDEYRKLKVGEKFDYYFDCEKKECVVTAINGKFVIAFSVYKTPVGNLKERTEQTAPEFAEKGMQKAYNAFVSIKAIKGCLKMKPFYSELRNFA